MQRRWLFRLFARTRPETSSTDREKKWGAESFFQNGGFWDFTLEQSGGSVRLVHA